MDSYQQQHHGYLRPPPPPPPQQQQQVPSSATDPYQYFHQHQPRTPVPPQPQGGASWYSNHFQYYPPPQPAPPPSHSPSPPPPQQWPRAPPPPPPPSSSYAYPTHLPPQNHHFPPPRPHVPPPTQPYSQEWGNPNWGQHQTWEYPVASHNHAEDWAAKARAWAAAKKGASDDQHPQPQFTPVGRSEEQSWYYDQYAQTVETHYQGVQQQPFPSTGYQHFPVSATPSHQMPVAYPEENASFNMGQSPYISDRPLPCTSGAATSNASPSVHQQEVPSSYSSVTGKEETGNLNPQLYKSLPLPISSAEGHHQLPPSLPATGRSVLTEQPFAYGNQAANPTADLSNQPLEFAPGFNRDHNPHVQSSYAAHHDSAGTLKCIGPSAPMPSIGSWNPAVTTGVVYPPIPPVLPPRPQDPTIAVPSSVSGHAALPFGNFPGASFQPTISAAGAPYGLGAGNALHPTGSFTEVHGVSNVSERPKKPSVPNWLKEEIIKNAPVMTRPSVEDPREETDEDVDKSFGEGDQAGSKSIDSPRSTEEEDDDEDYAEAARAAAINQEIKRILTEVLLKVTDELFDEIATKVLDEDDLVVEVEHQLVASNQKVSSPSHPAISTPGASAKILVPVRMKVSENEDVNEKSSSSSPGNVLGLANYASDEDDNEVQSSSISNSRKNSVIPEIAQDMSDAAENSNPQVELGKNNGVTNLESDLSKTSSVGFDNKINGALSGLSECAHSTVDSGARHVEISVNGEQKIESNKAVSKATIGENVKMKSEPLGESINLEKSVDYSQARDTRLRSGQDSRHESRSSGNRADEKGGDSHRRQDGKHPSKEKIDDLNGLKEKKKERDDKARDSAEEPESRRRSSYPEVEEDRKEAEKPHKSCGKEDATRKRVHTKEKEEDRARHKPTSDLSKHKRTRSSSISSRGRNSKVNDSSDEVSDDSKRKHSRKRLSSPSPARSRRRQVSRSPHSKHSQRRHSPYSSLETTRRRRSRSQSPVRRHK